MPCQRIGHAIVCSQGQRRRVIKCAFCSEASAKLCDGRAPDRHGSCDKPICDLHATSQGPNVDYCPTCQHRSNEQKRVIKFADDLAAELGKR